MAIALPIRGLGDSAPAWKPYNHAMADVRPQLDAIMDDASRALVAMDYLTCEARCIEALGQARAAEDWSYYARILLPLQEARRQRRMIAAEGTIRVGTPDLKDEPATWLERLSPGCVVMTPPHTPDQAGQLQQLARRRRLHVEVLFAEPGQSAWRLRTSAGRVAECDFRPPPVECLHRWLSDPADGRRQDAAEWFIDATEALGDALIEGVGEAPGTRGRIVALESCLDAMTDHEKLHQRLADAARAMKHHPDMPTPTPTSTSRPAAASPSTSPSARGKGIGVGKIIRNIALFLIVFAVLLGAGAWWMWSRTPAHWSRHQAWKHQFTAAERMQMAVALETRVINALTRVNGTDVRTIEATPDEINAWLDQRARDLLSHQSIAVPGEIGDATFAVNGHQPVLAFELSTAEISQIVSLYGDLKLRDDGTAFFRIDKVLGGELPIPAGMLTGHMSKSVPEHYARRVEEFAQGFRGVDFEPVFDLDPDRRWRVLAVEMQPEKVTMTVRVEPRR